MTLPSLDSCTGQQSQPDGDHGHVHADPDSAAANVPMILIVCGQLPPVDDGTHGQTKIFMATLPET
jgi:hypothetical protein